MVKRNVYESNLRHNSVHNSRLHALKTNKKCSFSRKMYVRDKIFTPFYTPVTSTNNFSFSRHSNLSTPGNGKFINVASSTCQVVSPTAKDIFLIMYLFFRSSLHVFAWALQQTIFSPAFSHKSRLLRPYKARLRRARSQQIIKILFCRSATTKKAREVPFVL